MCLGEVTLVLSIIVLVILAPSGISLLRVWTSYPNHNAPPEDEDLEAILDKVTRTFITYIRDRADPTIPASR
jgi:hypothetical protein